MKIYKVTLSILDFDELGEDEIQSTIENIKYPNWCISPKVMSCEGKEIGEWSDDHVLNISATHKEEFNRLFNKD